MDLLRLYHRLPYSGRCLAASLRGLYLRRWRYGPETPRLVEEALERESWTTGDWRIYQRQALGELLERAALRVPYYRRLWKARPGDGWRDLENWPILSKQEVLRDPRAFVADDCDTRQMFPEHTSGSTGTPLRLWWSRRATLGWYALVEARLRRWNGVTQRDPWAIFGGQLVTPATRRRPPFWVWNRAFHQLYLSSYHLEPSHAAAYVEALARHRIRYLLGYPSAMAILARFVLEQGIEAPKMVVALSNAEPLFPSQRQVISEAFSCPVRDTYGTAELVCGASECHQGRLHLWPEVGITEVVADEEVAAPSGRLVLTGLLNRDMPLIRYEVGDLGVLGQSTGPDGDGSDCAGSDCVGSDCGCSRRLPLLESLEGRLDDVIVTPEGRRIGRLDPVFKSDLPIREAQIVQESLHRVVLRVVPSPEYGPGDARHLASRLAERLGTSMEIQVEEVDRLPRGRAGKLRAVVSNL